MGGFNNFRIGRGPAAAGVLGVFVACAAAANYATARLGLVPVGFGLTATAGTYAAGLALLLRDALADLAGRRAVVAAIIGGAVVSSWSAPASLAAASAAAFALSELADAVVYQPLRRRGWVRAVVVSNAVGAVVDTVVFLAVAGFPVWPGLGGQLAGKAWATAVPVVVVAGVRRVRPRAVSGEPVHG